ncbi:type II toxin-antitoxin system prevent-host-death family antitoxin [Nocardiopsis potens]|uniref:type II toxin-antitoxin system prevent-host-death family antitoxin n=1 Tax=Nocardiopsis potens TaxID=1246458 RepID=UPI00034B5E30|nr:type II toxin-antitoxin system prevent-host-death family antitoxin [Nocardiopsis potens]
MDDTADIEEFRAAPVRAVDAAERQDRVTVVTRAGRPVAAVVPVFMLEKLEEWEDLRLAEAAEQALAESTGRTFSLAEVTGEGIPEAPER